MISRGRGGSEDAGEQQSLAQLALEQQLQGPGGSSEGPGLAKDDVAARELRQVLVIMCSFCTALSYCDRVNMSVAVVDMSSELGWDLNQRAAVLAAFFWGYIWSQVPGAFLARRYGGHIVLGIAALCWSVATLAVPVLAQISHRYVVYGRMALGVFEGCVFPVIYHLFASRVPKEERSRALGSINFGVFGGAIFSFAVSPVLMHKFHWSTVFYFFGTLGLLWSAAWLFFSFTYEKHEGTSALPCTNRPSKSLGRSDKVPHARGVVNNLSLLTQAKLIVCHKVVLAIFWCHFSHNVGTFVMMSWLPTFFEEAFGLGGSSLALTCLPYVAMAIAVRLSSAHADGVIARGELSLSQVRRMSTVAGFLGAGTFMILIGTTTHAVPAIFFMCLALACNGAGPVAGYEAAKLDVATPEYVGRLQSISNTLAAFAGIIGVPMVAWIKTSTGSWNGVFVAMAAVFFSAAATFHRFGHYSGKVVPG